MKKITLANFGKVPLANNLLNSKDEKFETYPLIVGFDPKTSLVELKQNAPKELMFNEQYVYDSSKSQTMVKHFKSIANKLEKKFKPNSVLEIGSNAGEFIKHFKCDKIGIEPCENFAIKTRNLGIRTWERYWDDEAAQDLSHGYRHNYDIIYSSNTISHIHDLDSCFMGIKRVLSYNGVFVMESPSLLSIVKNNIVDQFYHEHQSYFSLISVKNIIEKYGLKVFDIEEIDVHGGSLRYYIKHKNYVKYKVSKNVRNVLRKEKRAGLDNVDILKNAFKKMKDNLKELKAVLSNISTFSKKNHYVLLGYGATAKLSLVLNLAKIDNKIIEVVLDTTPEKWNKFIPGTNIKIIPYKENFLNKESLACFLGAWNYEKEIKKKEKKYLNNGGVFISHIPNVHIIK